VSAPHPHGESALWQLLDAGVYLAAGLLVGVLIAVFLGRGSLPTLPDSPAALLDLDTRG